MSDKEPIEVWISNPNKYSSGVFTQEKHFEDAIKMIEKSAFDAKCAEVETLKKSLDLIAHIGVEIGGQEVDCNPIKVAQATLALLRGESE